MSIVFSSWCIDFFSIGILLNLKVVGDFPIPLKFSNILLEIKMSMHQEENTWTLNSVNTIISNSSQILQVEEEVISFLLTAEHPPPYFDARS